MKTFLIVFILLPFSFFGQAPFSDSTLDAGIDNIYDVYQGLFGGGVVAFDYDNDGYEDLFITGGQGRFAQILKTNNVDLNINFPSKKQLNIKVLPFVGSIASA